MERHDQDMLYRHLFHLGFSNAVWHIDGYDKLKPFGICISGCIDGYSRQLIWLEAWKTNNDPRIIAGYFIEAVESRGGCPERVRADDGTENIFVQQMQIFLRSDHDDRYAGRSSYLRGRSTANQRIESWWGILRKEGVNFWIDLFKQLKDDGYFSGCFLDKNLVQFCFMDMIQKDIDNVGKVWKCHRIRNQRNDMPGGRPIMMYAYPELQGFIECIKPVDAVRVNLCLQEASFKDEIPCDGDIYRLCIVLMEEMNLELPTDPYEMCNLYIALRQEIENLLN